MAEARKGDRMSLVFLFRGRPERLAGRMVAF